MNRCFIVVSHNLEFIWETKIIVKLKIAAGRKVVPFCFTKNDCVG
jgi:hypothetical protein